ncbi:MAG: tetratricopeptide repeat protein [Candidatus Omnitrophica bacterium]|nr:tetratricopeptide repeat protein [Candidatus Omnitrophota bacterium]
MKINEIKNQPWIYFVGIIMLGLAVYFKSIFYELTFLDDNVWVLDYHWYLKNVENAFKLFGRSDLLAEVFYRPLLNLLFLIDAQIYGQKVYGYHLTNILIHLLNAYLVFLLLKGLRYSVSWAYLSALIFLVHPALVSAVSWIPGRTDSLLSLFAFFSFIAFQKFCQSKKWSFGLWHLLALTAALLVKETAIGLPFFCGLYVILIRKENVFERRYCLLECIWLVIAIGWFIIRKNLTDQNDTITWMIIYQSVFNNSSAFVTYLGKIILPVNLSVLPIIKDTQIIWGCAAILMLISGIVLSKSKDYGYLIFGLLWYVLFLLPSMVVSFLFHEYRLYLPMIGIFIVLLEIVGGRQARLSRWKFVVVLLLIVVFAGMSFIRSDNYKERFAFWKSAVQTSPHSPLAHRNLGAMYFLVDDLDKAEQAFRASAKLNFKEQMVHNNLGLIYMRRGNLVSAEKEYLLEIRFNPTYDNVYYNLGLLYYMQKKFDQAVQSWKKTIALNPLYIDAYKLLAVHYYNTRNLSALSYYVNQLKMRRVDYPLQYDQLLNQQ